LSIKAQKGATIKTAASLWKGTDREYQVGDVVIVLVSKKRPEVAEVVTNLNSLRFKLIAAMLIIFVLVFSIYKITSQNNLDTSDSVHI
jgi:hypothetical protein